MKLSLVALLAAVIVLSGCASKEERPEDILTPEQMTNLLIDVYVAEAVTENVPMLRDSSIKYFIPFEKKLLADKHIPDSILRKSYEYYIARPKEFEKIYDVVIDSLTLREQRTMDRVPKKE
jgi:hypothetical protein